MTLASCNLQGVMDEPPSFLADVERALRSPDLPAVAAAIPSASSLPSSLSSSLSSLSSSSNKWSFWKSTSAANDTAPAAARVATAGSVGAGLRAGLPVAGARGEKSRDAAAAASPLPEAGPEPRLHGSAHAGSASTGSTPTGSAVQGIRASSKAARPPTTLGRAAAGVTAGALAVSGALRAARDAHGGTSIAPARTLEAPLPGSAVGGAASTAASAAAASAPESILNEIDEADRQDAARW